VSKHQFLLPFEAIKEEPLLFILWMIVAVGVGLAGFWIPMFVQHELYGVKVVDVFHQLVSAAVLPVFGVTFVSSTAAEAFVGYKTRYDEKTTRALSIWRVIVGTICGIVVLLQGLLLSANLSARRSGSWQWALLVSSLLLGVYLYGLGCNFCESVEHHLHEENADMRQLGEAGKKVGQDDSGVKL